VAEPQAAVKLSLQCNLQTWPHAPSWGLFLV